MHTDSKMKDILRSGFMHYTIVVSLEMSDEPKNSLFPNIHNRKKTILYKQGMLSAYSLHFELC